MGNNIFPHLWGKPQNGKAVSKSSGKYKVSQMVDTVDEDEKLVSTIKTPGQVKDYMTTRYNNTSATFLTEDGLCEVLMQSRKPIAKGFVVNIDFITIEQKVDGKNKGRFTGTEYMLTVDTAKNSNGGDDVTTLGEPVSTTLSRLEQ